MPLHVFLHDVVATMGAGVGWLFCRRREEARAARRTGRAHPGEPSTRRGDGTSGDLVIRLQLARGRRGGLSWGPWQNGRRCCRANMRGCPRCLNCRARRAVGRVAVCGEGRLGVSKCAPYRAAMSRTVLLACRVCRRHRWARKGEQSMPVGQHRPLSDCLVCLTDSYP